MYTVDKSMKYFTDGFTLEKNPSPRGGGYTIFNEKNELLKTQNIDKSGMTNNEAEILGVFECLKLYCKEGDIISTDSMNTIAWVRTKKLGKVARQDLLDIIIKCKKMIEDKKVNLIWEGREYNLAGVYNEKNKIDTCDIGLFGKQI